MPIEHITELFALDGRDFITEAYHHLLQRKPDVHGMAYYLGRLAQGHGKAAVIAQLAQSQECRPWDEIKGLNKLIADERRAKHWFWGLFGQRQRLEHALQRGANVLALQQQSNLLQDALNKQTQALGQIARQIEASGSYFANGQASSSSQGQSPTDTAQLSAETVREVFVRILGREPESAETIRHHAQLESPTALRVALMSSEEFQLKMAALPEYARQLYKRQIQQQTTPLGA
jgi:hypothetical protein